MTIHDSHQSTDVPSLQCRRGFQIVPETQYAIQWKYRKLHLRLLKNRSSTREAIAF